MALFGSSEKSFTKKVRELINGALTEADKKYKKAEDFINSAYHGHGGVGGERGTHVSEIDAAEHSKMRNDARKELAAKLHDIANQIEQGGIW